MNKIDALNLEWSSAPSRDRQMATLVCNYLRYMGYEVLEDIMFLGCNLINKYKPRLYFNVGPIGAKTNFKVMKYARGRNIVAVSLVAEGNFRTDKNTIGQFVWGWNKKKVLYENLNMQWSERTRNATYEYFPQLKGKVKVSGAVGFDIYKISKNKSQKEFLEKYHKSNYKKVIGVGCWDFGAFHPEDRRHKTVMKLYSESDKIRFNKDQSDFNKVLLEVISKNKDILFLLKEHPGVLLGRKASGIEGAEKFDNALIIKNEESIINCISVSDFWLTFESTTAIEAWMLNKQTCLLNPNGIDFPRANVYKGSPNYPDTESLQNAINIFYKRNELPGFAELVTNRKEIIQETIQWDDGLNHVRAGNEIIDLIENTKSDIAKENISQKIQRTKQNLQYKLSPILRFIGLSRTIYQRIRQFDNIQLKKYVEKIYEEQLHYYNKLDLSKSDLRKIKCI